MLKGGCCFPQPNKIIKFRATRLLAVRFIYRNCSSTFYLSELTKFELIITIFEHNCDYLNPTLRTLSELMYYIAIPQRPMITKTYEFYNLPHILPILQKGRTTVEWTWWHHRNAKKRFFPQRFLANKPQI